MGNIKKISFHEFLPKPEIQVSGILDLSLSAEREPALSLRSLRAHREVSKALATRVVPSFHLVIIDQLSVSMSKNVKNYPATISIFL